MQSQSESTLTEAEQELVQLYRRHYTPPVQTPGEARRFELALQARLTERFSWQRWSVAGVGMALATALALLFFRPAAQDVERSDGWVELAADASEILTVDEGWLELEELVPSPVPQQEAELLALTEDVLDTGADDEWMPDDYQGLADVLSSGS